MIDIEAREVDRRGDLEKIVIVDQEAKAGKEIEEDLVIREVLTQVIDPKETQDFIQVTLVLEIGDQCMKEDDTPDLVHQIEATIVTGAKEVDLEAMMDGAQAQKSTLDHEVGHEVEAEGQEMRFMLGVRELP